MNQFLPYLFILNHFGSERLMCHGKPQNFKVVNRPILKADILEFCLQMLESEDIVPPNADLMSFLTKLGFTYKGELEEESQNPSSISE